MKYIIEKIPMGTGCHRLNVVLFSEHKNHCDMATDKKGRHVVGAGFCTSTRSGVTTYGESKSLNKTPHALDASVLLMFLAGELEQQDIVLAELYVPHAARTNA